MMYHSAVWEQLHSHSTLIHGQTIGPLPFKRMGMQVIVKLDAKRDEQVEDTWHKVSVTFSKIFSILLPGTEARLEPPEGCSCLEGLEVRVAFGGVWKESLSELSGGQRSLLTLSLILALLEFRPAPMYILDEVRNNLQLHARWTEERKSTIHSASGGAG